MIFERTPLDGLLLVSAEAVEDERGSFTRTFCEDEWRRAGLDPHVAQCSTSFNPHAGTLRGLHLQLPPHGETKLVRCTRGEIFDVVVDLRSGSPTFGAHHAVILSGANRLSLAISPGLAHGFLTLAAQSEVAYQISTAYAEESASGVRWDDPMLGIAWPEVVNILVSDRDASLPSLEHWG